MTKKYIKEYKTLNFYTFDGTLQDLQNKIKELIDEGWADIQVTYCHEDGYDSYELSKLRLETDEEYNSRIKFENKEKERRAKEKKISEKRERETYLRLKKKFESS